jgi:hypothetical protein
VGQQPRQPDLRGRDADAVGDLADHRVVGDTWDARERRSERKERNPRDAPLLAEFECRLLRAVEKAVGVLHADDVGGKCPLENVGPDGADADRADLALVAHGDHLGQLVVEADDLIALGGPRSRRRRFTTGMRSRPSCSS